MTLKFPSNATEAERRNTEYFVDQIKQGARLDKEMAALVGGVCPFAYMHYSSVNLSLMGLAAEYGLVNTMRALKARGTPIDDVPGFAEPVVKAMHGGHEDAVLMLFAEGVEITPKLLALAAEKHLATMVQKLLDAGLPTETKINQNGAQPIHYAEDKETAEALCKAGADINARFYNGKSAAEHILDAKAKGWLLDRGANIYAANFVNKTALRHIMEWSQYNEILQKTYQWREDYESFVKTGTSLLSAEDIYHMLAVTPLADPQAPVDDLGHIKKMVMHIHWRNRGQAEKILGQLHEDGRLSAADVEDMLAARFPQERERGQGRMR